MTDVHTPDIRSKNMRAIRGGDTKPEIILRKKLHKAGFRYRISPKNIPGKPDIYLPKYNAVIFINGCFWHAHGCYLFRVPLTRKEFWRAKLSSNAARDMRNIRLLSAIGYRILVVWECALKGRFKPDQEMLHQKVGEWIRSECSLAVADTKGVRWLTGSESDFNDCFGQIIDIP